MHQLWIEQFFFQYLATCRLQNFTNSQRILCSEQHRQHTKWRADGMPMVCISMYSIYFTSFTNLSTLIIFRKRCKHLRWTGACIFTGNCWRIECRRSCWLVSQIQSWCSAFKGSRSKYNMVYVLSKIYLTHAFLGSLLPFLSGMDTSVAKRRYIRHQRNRFEVLRQLDQRAEQSWYRRNGHHLSLGYADALNYTWGNE